MKNKNLLIITLIFIIILLSVQLILNKIEITNRKTKIMKEMSESEQVTDLNNQINALNIEHTQYMNYIQTCKTAIATALTNEGVEISDQATFETMAGDISKVLQKRTSDATATAEDIAEGKTAYVNGKLVTGNFTNNNISSADIVTTSVNFNVSVCNAGDVKYSSELPSTYNGKNFICLYYSAYFYAPAAMNNGGSWENNYRVITSADQDNRRVKIYTNVYQNGNVYVYGTVYGVYL